MQNTRNLPFRRSEIIDSLITELIHIEHQLLSEHVGPLTKPMFYRASQVRKMLQDNIEAYGFNVPDNVLAIGYDVVFEYDYLFKDEDCDPKNLLHHTYVGDTKVQIASGLWFKNRLKEKRDEISKNTM